MKLAGWNGKVPVLSDYLMEEDALCSFVAQGFSLFTVSVQCVMLPRGVDQTGLVLLISLTLCFAGLLQNLRM